MKIAHKLSLGFLSLALFVASLGLLTSMSHSSLQQKVDVVHISNVGEVYATHEIAYHLQRVKSKMHLTIIESEHNNLDGTSHAVEQIKISLEKIDTLMAQLQQATQAGVDLVEELSGEEDELAQVMVVSKELSEIKTIVEEFISHYRDGQNITFEQAMSFERLMQSGSRLTQQRIEELETDAFEEISDAVKEIRWMIQNNQEQTILFTLTAFLFAIMMGFVISRAITKNITSIKQATSLIGQGELDTEIKISSSDELAELAVDINQMAFSLKSLTVSRDELTNEINERIRTEKALILAKEEAEKADVAKSEFLANMSHELRTPLNAILGFSDLLRRDAGLSEDHKHTLATIHKSGDHLLGIINDVLEISKIETGRVTLESVPFNLGEMIVDVIQMLRITAQKKSLELQVEFCPGFPEYVVADEAKLRQILINLISNAIKATELGGIRLHLGLKHNQVDHLLIEVEDSGIGIAPADQKKIFDDFVQIGRQGDQQGTGLGLPITRQFIALMGGELRLTSVVGQGSIFHIDLPVQLAQPDEVVERVKARGTVTGLAAGQPDFRILVVEDHANNQQVLRRLLESVGLAVEVANNGVEAVEQFSHWQPHFIWMDRRMPVMDGVEATRRIRSLPGGELVKIAAVTASSFKEDDTELKSAGFDAVLHKPYRLEQIFQCMGNLLGMNFDYEHVMDEESPPFELCPTAFAAIPEVHLHDLAQALLILDSERIHRVIDVITQINPELGCALRGRAQSYDYEPIMALLQSRASS